jgi:hypothetical protein
VIWTAAALASVTALMALAPGSEMILQSIRGRIDPRARSAGGAHTSHETAQPFLNPR